MGMIHWKVKLEVRVMLNRKVIVMMKWKVMIMVKVVVNGDKSNCSGHGKGKA